MSPVFDPLERIAFLEREVKRLREGEECHVARPGEGTYECRHDNKCAACRLRSAEWRVQNAFMRGAEEMREACAARIGSDPALLVSLRVHCESALRALPIPEEP